jgi:Ku protein
MKDKDRVALGRVVLSNREHVVAIEPSGKGLIATTLRYAYEVRDEDDYFDSIKAAKISKDMVELAAHILDSKAAHFDPGKFKDDYETALKALVKRKAAGKTIEPPKAEERGDNVVDLMDALRQSLKGKKGSSSRRTSSAHSSRTPARRRAVKKKPQRSSARSRKAG